LTIKKSETVPVHYASKVESQERRIDPIELSEWARVCKVDPQTILRAMGQ
jgi:hypothetical protein